MGTSNHYLNCYSSMLSTECYTWRHNNLINFIVTNVDKKFHVFSDLTGWEARGVGTIPANLCVTNLKQDIVIDTQKKQMHLFELTCPLSMNIEKTNLEKSWKYAPLGTDITGYACTVNCFKVNSTGFICKRNKSTLSTPYSFISKDIKKSTFLSNGNSSAWYGSYKIWLTCDDPALADPPFLIADIPTFTILTMCSSQRKEEQSQE